MLRNGNSLICSTAMTACMLLAAATHVSATPNGTLGGLAYYSAAPYYGNQSYLPSNYAQPQPYALPVVVGNNVDQLPPASPPLSGIPATSAIGTPQTVFPGYYSHVMPNGTETYNQPIEYILPNPNAAYYGQQMLGNIGNEPLNQYMDQLHDATAEEVAPDVNPYDPMQQALSLHQAGRFTEAIQIYESIIRTTPPDPRIYASIADAHLRLGNFDRAFKYNVEALKLDPDYSSAHLLMGAILGDMGDLIRSIRSYERVIAIDPNNPYAYYNLGLIYYKKDDVRSAIEFFTRAQRLNPLDPKIHNNLGVAHYDQGDFKLAAAAFKRAMQVDPNFESAKKNYELVLPIVGEDKPSINSNRKAKAKKVIKAPATQPTAVVQPTPTPSKPPTPSPATSNRPTLKLDAPSPSGSIPDRSSPTAISTKNVVRATDTNPRIQPKVPPLNNAPPTGSKSPTTEKAKP